MKILNKAAGKLKLLLQYNKFHLINQTTARILKIDFVIPEAQKTLFAVHIEDHREDFPGSI